MAKGKEEKQEQEEMILDKYHYYGDVVSEYQIGGKAVMLHPGQEVELPADDDTVKSLVAQALLVKYMLEKKKIGGADDDSGDQGQAL